MAANQFTGTGVAIVTPFRNDESVDFPSLEKLIGHLIAGGVDYLVVMGTTGESVTLNRDEKHAVLEFVKEASGGKIPIVVGIGGNNTQAVVSQIRDTDLNGVAGILSVAPYYNKPGQKGLYQHFKAIASASPVPVILYNVPGRTCSNISADTVVQLATDIRNIVAVKEASGNFSQVMEIIRKAPPGFQVISGDDGITLPMIALGGAGVISVLANALPAEWSEMVRLALQGNLEKAREIHYGLLPLIDLLFAEGNPAGIKAALACQGIISNHLRLPLTPVSRSLYQAISRELGKK
ncbi:MAG: 4-hydroxy-tetrahydrodipicolinate synthase [Bacteroidales bacterium]